MTFEETEEQLEERLCKVVAQADTTFSERCYAWSPLTSGVCPSADALACVSDDRAWFEFAPSRSDEATGQFRVVCFRFSEAGPGAIGFVGWLHSHLRRMGKTGAIVICGKDRRNAPQLLQICQGVIDYWACPVGSAGDRFVEVIRTLIERGKSHG